MKSRNYGFSLIELIIVIAIMAILVAIIAPNLTKYLSKSKRETDEKNANEIASQLHTCITDYESENSSDGVDANEKTLIADDDSSAIVAVKWNASKNGYSSIKNSSSSASSTESDLDDFDKIVNQVVTAKTESKEKSGNFAEAEITKINETSYSVKVKLGNAEVVK
jgi:type IV pilus assembly protein PilA